MNVMGRRRGRPVLIAAAAILATSACGHKSPNSPTANAPGGAPVGSTAPWSGKPLHGNDAASLRTYLETVEEIKPTKFNVQWSPDTVAFDKAAALRSLHAVSSDGRLITLASNEPAVAKLKPGSIIWVWDICIRRVDAVAVQGDETVVTTSLVSLTEAMPNAEIEVEAAPKLQNYYISRRVVPPVIKTTRLVLPRPPGFLLTSFYSDAPAAEPPQAPAATNADSATEDQGDDDDSDDWFDESLNANGVTLTLKGWGVSVSYVTQPAGITVELQARKGDEGGDADPSAAADSDALVKKYKEIETERKEIHKQIQQVEEDLRNEQKDLNDTDAQYQKDLAQMKQDEADRKNPNFSGPRPPPAPTNSYGTPLNDQGEQEQLKNRYEHTRSVEQQKLAEKEKILGEWQSKKADIEAQKRALKAAKGVAKQLWDIVSDNLDSRIRFRTDIDGFSMGSNFVFKDGNVNVMHTEFKNLNGKIHAQYIGRLGKAGNQGLKVPVMNIPVAFNVPYPVGGIPLVIQVGADFNLTMFLSGLHATMSLDGEAGFHGDTGIDYSGGKATTSGNLAGDPPKMTNYTGISPGVSAVVLGVQLPRIGVGLGVFGASSVAYVDFVSVVTFENSAGVAVLSPTCKHVTYTGTAHIGVQTDVTPLPFAALTDWVNKNMSAKKEVVNVHEDILDPPAKICEIAK